jgi:hypothetical protein
MPNEQWNHEIHSAAEPGGAATQVAQMGVTPNIICARSRASLTRKVIAKAGWLFVGLGQGPRRDRMLSRADADWANRRAGAQPDEFPAGRLIAGIATGTKNNMH